MERSKLHAREEELRRAIIHFLHETLDREMAARNVSKADIACYLGVSRSIIGVQMKKDATLSVRAFARLLTAIRHIKK